MGYSSICKPVNIFQLHISNKPLIKNSVFGNNIVLKNTLCLKHDIINFKNLFLELITLNREDQRVNKQIRLDCKLKGV